MSVGVSASKYVACFFDMLGQSVAYSRLSDPNITQEQIEGIICDAREVMSVVDYLEEVVGMIIENSSDVLSQLKQNKSSIFDEVSLAEFIRAKPSEDDCQVVPFSDGVLIYVKEGSLWAGLIFLTWLMRLAEVMVGLHSKHISVRGVVSIGEAYPVGGGSICGPLVDELDKLEKGSAFYSRIIMSHKLEEYVGKLVKRHFAGEKVDVLFFLFRELFDADIDGVLMLNYLSEHMLIAQNRYGRLNNYLQKYKKAEKVVGGFVSSWQNKVSQGEIDISKSDVVWKYQFLDTYYGAAETEMSNFITSHTFSDWDRQELGLSPLRKGLGDYYVAYGILDKLADLPENYDGQHKYETVFDIVKSDGDTAGLLKDFISQFHNLVELWKCQPEKIYEMPFINKELWKEKEKFCRYLQELSIGVEQIGKYILVFVRKDSPLSMLFFVATMQILSSFMLEALVHNHVVSLSCCVGKGWEAGKNRLMGPCIGEAHKQANRYSFYPRISISPKLEREISNSKSCAYFFGGNKGYPVFQDVDGIYLWDYLLGQDESIYNERKAPQAYNDSIEFVYRNLSRRMGYFARFGKNKEYYASKVRPLLVLHFFLQEKLRVRGINCDIIKEAIIMEMNKPQK